MKKVLSMVLAMFLLIGLAGCGEQRFNQEFSLGSNHYTLKEISHYGGKEKQYYTFKFLQKESGSAEIVSGSIFVSNSNFKLSAIVDSKEYATNEYEKTANSDGRQIMNFSLVLPAGLTLPNKIELNYSGKNAETKTIKISNAQIDEIKLPGIGEPVELGGGKYTVEDVNVPSGQRIGDPSSYDISITVSGDGIGGPLLVHGFQTDFVDKLNISENEITNLKVLCDIVCGEQTLPAYCVSSNKDSWTFFYSRENNYNLKPDKVILKLENDETVTVEVVVDK